MTTGSHLFIPGDRGVRGTEKPLHHTFASYFDGTVHILIFVPFVFFFSEFRPKHQKLHKLEQKFQSTFQEMQS